jgi:hypothetical protein
MLGLLIAGAILSIPLLAGQDRPEAGRCAALWNAPANQANRSSTRGRLFRLATVRGVGPNKAGRPGCSVLFREAKDGPWLLVGGELVTDTTMVWGASVSGIRYGTDSPTGDVDDTPNATLQSDGSVALR